MGVEDGKSNGGSTVCNEKVQCFKNEGNGFEFGNCNDIAKSSEGASEGVRTYKRRRYARLSWDGKSQEDGGADVESSSQLANQLLKEPVGTIVHNNSCEQVHRINSSDVCSERHWRNSVLENMYQSLGNEEGGVQVSIQQALEHFREIDHPTRFKESGDCNEDMHQCDFPTQSVLKRPQNAANGHGGLISNGSSNKSHHSVTAMCQQAFFDVLVSEKFASLCKLFLENFQGTKMDSIFNLNLINSRMKKGDYEHSPMLFSADMQQVWRKLQGIGTNLISLANSLSEVSRTSYNGQVGGSVHSTFQDGKNEFCTLEADSHTKLEQIEDRGVLGVSTCMHCGGKANGQGCLVCDSCEDMYHVSCIHPAVKEIPTTNWFCVTCTASGIRSSHEDCVVCERLNVPKTLVNGIGGESVSTDEETDTDMEEASNYSADGGIQQSKDSKDLNVCRTCGNEVENGEKLKACEHPYCPKINYHVKCLTSKQLRSYGPRWYCYSCLCRQCLTDQDDDMIVLCDGCDHGYHIYCMDPPRTSIPSGKWFCRKCQAAIKDIKKAKKAYNKNEKKQRKNGEGSRKSNGKGSGRESEQGTRGGMGLLLSAVKTLDHEEDMKNNSGDSSED